MKSCIYKILLLLCILLTRSSFSFASHVLGGDITYKNLGNDSVLVTMEYFRNCVGLQIDANPITVTETGSIYDIQTTEVSTRDITPITNSALSLCANPSSNFPFGMQMVVLTAKFKIDSFGCDYILSESICCLDNAITTGARYKNFYIESRINICEIGIHNSPTFEFDPLLINCVNTCVSAYQNALSDDGDSLVYSLVSPQSAVGSPIGYYSPYTQQTPVIYEGSDPNGKFEQPFCLGFHLDPATGELNFKAVKDDETVFCVKVDQWHKNDSGVYKNIGYIIRQTTLAIIDCPTNRSPIITGIDGSTSFTMTSCLGSTINFKVPAFDLDPPDTVSMIWDNGIPNATFDINTGKKWPTGVFNWTPNASDFRAKPYTFMVTVSDNHSPLHGKSQQMFTIYLVKDSFPKVTYSKKHNGCGLYTFEAEADTSLKAKFNWAIDGNAYISQNNPISYQFTKAGEHHIDLQITSKYGCVEHILDSINTDTLRPAKTSFALKNTCDGMPVSIINNTKPPVGQGVKYLWKFGDGTTSTSAQPTKSYQGAHYYNVWLITKTDSGCLDSAEETIEIISGPIAIIGTITNNCLGFLSTFTDNSYINWPDSIELWRWNFGDSAISVQQNPYHTYTSSGLFDINLKIQTKAGCVDSLTKSITIYPLPNAGFKSAVAGHRTYNFSANDQTLSKYQWNFGDQDSGTGPNVIHNYAKDSTFTVTLQVTNNNSCVNITDSMLAINTSFINSLLDEKELNLKLSPNPFSDLLSFSFSLKNQSNVKVSIVDITGKTIAVIAQGQQQPGAQNFTIKTSDHQLKPGVYTFAIEINGQLIVREIVKQ